MAGHSKWANIKRRKGAQDTKRGSVWTKISREVTVATRMGGKNPGSNPRLRDAIALARSNNMPKDTIQRAISRGAGEIDSVHYEEVTYEGYGPGGAAIFIEATTDNRNRTVASLRNVFSKNGGSLGDSGCVAWMFTKKGLLEIKAEEVQEEKLFEVVVELGAEDLQKEEVFTITCPHENLFQLREKLVAKGYMVVHFEVLAESSSTVALDKENSEKMLKLMEAIEDLEDVQKVHTNADFTE